MPKIGDITHGRDLGKIGKYISNRKFIYCICPDCSETRWLILRPKTAVGKSRCQRCCGKALNSARRLPHGRGEKSPHWKGGKRLHHQGYVEVWISEESPYYPMATHKRNGGGTIFEHRLIVAQSLGRCLTRQEHVHHRNGIKSDNRYPQNLELISPSTHMLYDKMCAHCKLRKEIRMLKATIAELKSQSTFLPPK